MSDTPAIPIENIYYLFCYAWDRFEEAQTLGVGATASPDLPNLLARVLLTGTNTLLRRGLARGYQPYTEDIATVRGQIMLGPTLRLRARRVRRLSCQFDELSHDTLPNRILKASLRRLAKASTVNPGLARDMQRCSLHFGDVSDIRLERATFARVQLDRNQAGYGLLLHVAQLAFVCLLPEPHGNGYRFHDILRDERKMAGVFEAFVRNFFRAEQRHFKVEPLAMQWDAEPLEDHASGQLPSMRIDVFLRGDERAVIIDTKYYADALQRHRDAATLHSGHLYQLLAYLRNATLQRGLHEPEGLLLYPEARSRPDAHYRIHGHRVRIATVNLAQPWPVIAQRLHDLVGDECRQAA